MMKIFAESEILAAIEYSMQGNQALHLHRIIANRKSAPACFIKAVDSGQDIAHLMDQDESRLRSLVKSVGINKIYIHKKGTKYQHIDVCGTPLIRLKGIFNNFNKLS